MWDQYNEMIVCLYTIGTLVEYYRSKLYSNLLISTYRIIMYEDLPSVRFQKAGEGALSLYLLV